MKLQQLFACGSVLALALSAAAVASAQAASTVVVTPGNTQGWGEADTNAGGSVEFVTDATSPLPGGALQLTTDGQNSSRAQYMHEANVALSETSELSYSTKKLSGPATAAPSYQLLVDLNGLETTGGFTTLVYEPYWNGTVETGTWQSWDVAANDAQLWSSRSFSDEADCVVVAGAGGPPFYSLARLQSVCPDAEVIGFGVNVGTYNPNYVVETDAVVFNDTTYDFEQDYVTTGAITNPATDGEAVSGVVNFTATYDDGDAINDDAVQWAIRQGTCASGSNTVAGNVDGFTDTSDWDGADFSAMVDTSSWSPGEYCFIFNPTDDAGQNNVRLTRTFEVEQTVFLPTSKDDCKQDGYLALTDAEGNTFRNQGQCVSYFNHMN